MIDVHIGFMAEEVSELLKCLILDFGTQRPILAVEQGKIIKGGSLFETPFNKYASGKDDVTIAYVEYVIGKPTSSKTAPTLEGRIAYNLYQELYGDRGFIDQRIKNRVLLAENVNMGGPPNFSIINFNPHLKTTENPIILIRNPEMGKQPSLVRPYERAILKAISSLTEAHAKSNVVGSKPGIRIHSFASGGAIDPSLKPGHISRPSASLYVGAEVNEEGRVFAVVNLMALRIAVSNKTKENVIVPSHFEFYRTETSTTSELTDLPEDDKAKALIEKANQEAQALAEQFILDADDDLLHEVLANLKNRYNEAKALDDLGVPASHKPDITASFSYFDSLETKEEIWKKLGQTISNSNMEDYHVLRLVRSMIEKGGASHKYAPLVDCEILRLNANVFVPTKITEALTTHLKSARLNKAAYITSIIWGLKGCPLSDIAKLHEDVYNWRFYQELKKISGIDLSYLYTYQGKFCMDPFCCEIATNLIKELIKGDGKMISPKAYQLAQQIDKMAGTLDLNHDNLGELPKLVEELVEAIAEAGYKAEEKDEMYCWLRPGKWGLQDCILDEKTITQFTAKKDNIDRLLYKSAGLVALQALAQVAAKRTAIK